MERDGVNLQLQVGECIVSKGFLLQLTRSRWRNNGLPIVETTNTMHRFAPVHCTALFYILAPTSFGSSLPLSGSFWIRLGYMKIQIDLVVYHIMWLSGLCAGVSWVRLLCFPAELYYLLTPRSRVLLEKLTGLQLVKKFPAYYGI
jgi:hypothetical protein